MNETNAIHSLCTILVPYLVPYIKEAILSEEKTEQKDNKEGDKLISKKEVMRLLGVSSATLWRWEKAKYLIPIRLGGKTYYSQEQIGKLKNGI